MSVTVKKKTFVVHPLDDKKQEPAKETTALLPQSHKPRELTYGVIFFLMINRSINLVLYKAFTTFSWYFAQDFKMNYTLFALIAVMNFPGNLLNIAVVPYYHQFKVRYVIMSFEILLAASCFLILPFHNIIGLLVARLLTGFAITAARSEVNATIGAYTHGARRTTAISIVEYSFGFSSIGFLAVGAVLQNFGWQTFFVGAGVIIIIIAVLVTFIIPSWHIEYDHTDPHDQNKKKKKKKYSYGHIKQVISHKRLQLVFLSVLLNKIARNAFYYTFSKWLATTYGLNPQEAGYITLFVAAGCLLGSSVVPVLVSRFKFGIFFTCGLGALLQIFSMIIEPIYVLAGSHVTLPGACVIIFFYFCGCQIWYNNCLDIMIGVTPRPQLLPAVNTVLLAYGAFGGMIGTIGSTVWYEWGGESIIAAICAICNVGVACCVLLLWIANKKHKFITTKLKDAMGIHDDNDKELTVQVQAGKGYIEGRDEVEKEIKLEAKNKGKQSKIYPRPIKRRRNKETPSSPNIVDAGTSMVHLKILGTDTNPPKSTFDLNANLTDSDDENNGNDENTDTNDPPHIISDDDDDQNKKDSNQV